MTLVTRLASEAELKNAIKEFKSEIARQLEDMSTDHFDAPVGMILNFINRSPSTPNREQNESYPMVKYS